LRLSWNEIRIRAAQFSKDWVNAHYEKGETHSFYNDLFEVFGLKRRQVAVYERQVNKLDNRRGFIDLFWPSVLLVEQKSAGRNLKKAREQADEYCLGLKGKEYPRYILLSDFQTFELYDLEENIECKFSLENLVYNVEKLGFMIGVQKRTFKDQDPVNIEASELMGQIHDSLKDSGYIDHDLEQFLVRLLFCLFADDTGIFEPRGIFESLIKDRTAEDGSDLGQWLAALFEVLNTPEKKRYKTLDEDLAGFPYINGQLFESRLPIPAFDSDMRLILIEACEFSWDAISPAIFGALFQSVMDKEERRSTGSHYTTEKNILKVISSLFLDDLRDEFETIKTRKTQRRALLTKLQNKISALTFFDPACGCGNFLVIAYRELRQLELEILIENRDSSQLSLYAADFSIVDVDQFYGIEIGEFAARIAEVAMWMMDHIMNNRLSLEFGQLYARIPLKKSPHILYADALDLDWNEVLAYRDCSYIFGNPPFRGAKVQTVTQRLQVRDIANLGGSGGTLDFVAAWFLKAGEYINGTSTRIAFVATNSITQGEQVAQLWPLLFDKYGLEIIYSHRTFAWGSDARGKAHVHVVIIGLSHKDYEPSNKKLFSYPDINLDPEESIHSGLTAYLFDAGKLSNRHIVVASSSQPINGMPKLVIGSKPIDGGNYIFAGEAKDIFIKSEPEAKKFIHPYIGSREYLNGGDRWILQLNSATPAELKAMPEVTKLIATVKKFRKNSPSLPTQNLGDTPTKFHVTVVPDCPFLVMPESSSARREYLPIGWLEPPVIPSNLVKVLLGADKPIFAVLTSAMHMAWLRYIGGKIKSDYRYSIGLVYNNFPFPEISIHKRKTLETLAQKILDIRVSHHGSSLAEIYDPLYMPPELLKAHKAIDLTVDKLYRKSAFKSERERAEHLFGLYEKMILPI
jgi:hypothetical protein